MAFETGGDGAVLFVHAHPDDETIATGGTLALLTQAHIPVCVLTCTRGEQGEVIPDDLKHLEGDGAALAEFRESELVDAMRSLGITDHRFLGAPDARDSRLPPRRYEDSGMQWGLDGAEPLDDTGPDTFTSASVEEVISDLLAVIDELAPRAIVSYDLTGGYGHPDHVRAHLVSRAAADRAGVPFFEIVPSGSDAVSEPGVREVDIAPVFERKVAALRFYRTQLAVGDDAVTHTGGQVEPIAAIERFRQRDPLDSAGDIDPHPIASRLVPLSLAALGGVAAGLLGTSIHQFTVTAFDQPVWSGAIAALLLCAVLLAGLRLRYNTRWPAGFAAVGILLAVGVLSLEGPGGSILVPANEVGLFWAYGPIVLVVVAIAWPRLGGRRRDTMEETTTQGKDGDQL